MVSSSRVSCASSSTTRSLEKRRRTSSGYWGKTSASFTARTASTYGRARSSATSFFVWSGSRRANASACCCARPASRGSGRAAASSLRSFLTSESETGSGIRRLGGGQARGDEVDRVGDELLRLVAVGERDPVGPADAAEDDADPALVARMGLPVGVRRFDPHDDALADLERLEEPGDGGHPPLPDLLGERAPAARAESLRALDHLRCLPVVDLQYVEVLDAQRHPEELAEVRVRATTIPFHPLLDVRAGLGAQVEREPPLADVHQVRLHDPLGPDEVRPAVGDPGGRPLGDRPARDERQGFFNLCLRGHPDDADAVALLGRRLLDLDYPGRLAGDQLVHLDPAR